VQDRNLTSVLSAQGESYNTLHSVIAHCVVVDHVCHSVREVYECRYSSLSCNDAEGRVSTKECAGIHSPLHSMLVCKTSVLSAQGTLACRAMMQKVE
jgi:hypothetical protein